MKKLATKKGSAHSAGFVGKAPVYAHGGKQSCLLSVENLG